MLRPRMARLAGAVADVAVTWLTPPDYLQDVLAPQLRAGAEEAGRTSPRIVTVVPACVDGSGLDPVDVAYAGSHAHLREAHYCDMLRRSGLDADERSPRRTAEGLVAGGGFLTGTPAEIVRQAVRFRSAGVDELVLNVTGALDLSGLRATVADLHAVLEATGAVPSNW